MFKKSNNISGVFHQSILTRAGARGIRAQLINNSDRRGNFRMKHMLNLHAKNEGALGVVTLNREHRFNNLTEGMISDINRGLNTMNQDHTAKVIYIHPMQGKQWCNGTDFKTIAHMKKEDAYGRIQKYMEELYHLQTNVAQMNKPIIACAPGQAMNSGATLLAAMGHPMTTLDSKVAFNEVTFGFVPHSGATFYQSRLQGEFGTFMALTGLDIFGTESIKLGMAKGVIQDQRNFDLEIRDHVSALPWRMPGGHDQWEMSSEQDFYWDNRQHDQHLRVVTNEKLNERDQVRRERLAGEHQYEDRVRELKERIPSSVGEAEYQFMQHIRFDGEKEHPSEGTILDFAQGQPNKRQFFEYRNYYADVMNFIEDRFGDSWNAFRGDTYQHKMLIDRCFYHNTIEEIMDALSKETSQFAKLCHEAMSKNSKQSMQLALAMLRKAKNLDYKGCLEMELNVGFNRLQDTDFDLGIKEVLGAPRQQGAKFRNSPKWSAPLKESQIKRYFEENKYAKDIQLDVVENALLPTKDYYQKYTDQIRLYINQSSATQPIIREAFNEELKLAMREQGIDIRDFALTPDIVRNAFAGKHAQNRVEQIAAERYEQLMVDHKLRDEYFDKINSEVNKFDKDKNYFYNFVNEQVQESFQEAFQERLRNIYEKSSEAHSLEKRRMFLRLKKWYFRERIFTYGMAKANQEQAQLAALPFRQPHCHEKWDQSWRDKDVQHPEMWQSPMHYVAKAIGKVSLTTPEMAKAWLTDPSLRDQMTMFTLDKEELQKLRDHITLNFNEWEMMLVNSTRPKENRELILQYDTRHRYEYDHEEWEHWWRVFHDGECPVEQLPFYREYHDYKEWANSIEEKAIYTIRSLIDKLMSDHEHVGTEFEGSLVKMHKLLNDDYSNIEKVKRTEHRGQTMLGDDTRPISEIEKSIESLFKNDPVYGKFFDSLDTNPHVKSLTDELKAELVKLTSIILLDKHQDLSNYSTTERKEFERMLAQMTNPEQQSTEVQLNMIDQFLRRRNGEELIKEIFKLASPYLMQTFNTRLKEECRKTLDDLKYDENQQNYLIYLLMEKQYPKWQDHSCWKRLTQYNNEELVEEAYQKAVPEMQPLFHFKSMLQTIGHTCALFFGDQNMSAESQVEHGNCNHELIRRDMEKVDRFFQEQDENYKEQTFTPIWEKFMAGEIDEWEFRRQYPTRHRDIQGLYSLANQLYEMDQFLKEHRYDIDHYMDDFDCLNIVAQGFKKYGMDLGQFMGAKTEEEQLKFRQIGEYAYFITQLSDVIQDQAMAEPFDAISFIERQSLQGVQANQLYFNARAERERLLAEREAKTNVNRNQIVKKEIKDFNALKVAVKTEQHNYNNLRKTIQKQPESKRQKIMRFLDEQRQFIDYQHLEAKVANNDLGFIDEPVQVIDIEKLVNSYRGNVNKLDSSVDVLSLYHLKEQIRKDSSMNAQLATHLSSIVDYVDDRAKFMSNEDRKNLTVKDFMEKYHFTSSSAFKQYADDLLQNKIDAMLGKDTTNEADAATMDWQIGNMRTMPSEHVINEDVDSVLHRSDIQELYKVDSAELVSGLHGGDVAESLRKQPEQEIKMHHQNADSNIKETDNIRDYLNKQVYRKARDACRMPEGMEATRNFYENKLIRELINVDMDNLQVEQIVNEYTDMRLKKAMINKDFAKAMESENANMFLKMLREEVVHELGLNRDIELSRVSAQEMMDPLNYSGKVDPTNIYSTIEINNEFAIGYDNFEARGAAQTPQENYEAAHETVFEKMLAEYFLSKRGEYKETNKLIDDLAKVFESPKMTTLKGSSMDHLTQARGEIDIDQCSKPKIFGEDVRSFLNLDVQVSRAINHGKNGMNSEWRKQISITDKEHPEYFTTQVPDYFPVFDVRKPADEYVKDKLAVTIRDLFEMRNKVEKKMTRSELLAFDKVLSRYLQHESLMPKLKESIKTDYHAIDINRGMTMLGKDEQRDLEIQLLKHRHDQRGHNSKIVNEDAYYKRMAFSAMDDKRVEAAHLINRDQDDMHDFDSFKEHYRRRLRTEQEMPAREIDESAFAKRKPWDRPVGKPYQGSYEKQLQLENEFKIYKEGKLGQQERMRLFFVLEQMNEQARTTPDSNSKGQAAIREYFSDPDNTYFFDKNKIV